MRYSQTDALAASERTQETAEPNPVPGLGLGFATNVLAELVALTNEPPDLGGILAPPPQEKENAEAR